MGRGIYKFSRNRGIYKFSRNMEEYTMWIIDLGDGHPCLFHLTPFLNASFLSQLFIHSSRLAFMPSILIDSLLFFMFSFLLCLPLILNSLCSVLPCLLLSPPPQFSPLSILLSVLCRPLLLPSSDDYNELVGATGYYDDVHHEYLWGRKLFMTKAPLS